MELGGRWRTGGVLADADVCGGDGVGLEVEVCGEHGSSFSSFPCLFFGCANLLGTSYH